MAKRRVKKRTHVGAPGAPAQSSAGGPPHPGSRAPKSMVIRIGASQVGPSVSQLVRDVRSMMEPGTAARLKERRSNKLRDFTSMAGPLGVSHLLLFSRSESGNTNLRIAVTPRGPTLSFRVNNYSLCKDLINSMRRHKSGRADYMTSPLLVMNNFATKTADGKEDPQVPKRLEDLTTQIFQGLFPAISPTSTSLQSIKRVLLLDRLPRTSDASAPFVLSLRHYAISTPLAKSSIPKPLRRLNAATQSGGSTTKRQLPDLSRLEDVANYLLDPHDGAFTSGSESEPETDAEVEVLVPKTSRVLTKDERARLRAQSVTATRAANAAADADGDGEEATEIVSDDDDGDGEGRQAPRRNANAVQKKAIKLHELGPRMTLRLTKVEEGICGGKVLWHEYIHKTAAEMKGLEVSWAKKRAEKEERKKLQRENVERKKRERGSGSKVGKDGEDDEDEEALAEYDSDEDFWDGEEEGADADADAGVDVDMEN